MKIYNPATEELLVEVAELDQDELAERYVMARQVQNSWFYEGLGERIEVVERFGALLQERCDELALVLTRETGKPIAQARGEIQGVQSRIKFFVEEVPDILQPHVLKQSPAGSMERLSYEPLGVVANVSAWNYPYFVGSNVFIAALLTGNAVLYKPSEYATMTGLEIERCMVDAGVPLGVFSALCGDSRVGRELLEQPVDGVFFTGSYATGAKVAETTSRNMVRLQLELGGKDPAYVCEDADIEQAAESLVDGAFYNAGQSCCSVERIYVHADVYDAFLEHFLTGAEGLKVGDPTDEETYLGPLTRGEQLDVLDAQVADAIAKGATCSLGGERLAGKGHYFSPTVMTEVNHEMIVMKEESFGPIIGIQRVSGDDEALRHMNDTAYGLTAGVYSRARDRAEAILKSVQAGSVYWNCCDRVSPRLPWTGWKHSGMGSTLGLDGIRAFLRPKAWHLNKVG